MTIHHGDNLDVLPTFPECSVDAIVTDPPYDLTGHRWDSLGATPEHSGHVKGRGGFMGKAWDGTGIAFRPETWEAMLPVAKPGAYLLAFGGTRTVHRMTCAIEDAGWVIRDVLCWCYAQGFPKSKASLKPAWEPIVMARKPGLAAPLQIDAARIAFTGPADVEFTASRAKNWTGRSDPGPAAINVGEAKVYDPAPGRWPANVLLTDPVFDGGWESVEGGGEQRSPEPYVRAVDANVDGWGMVKGEGDTAPGYGDAGTYSRFFLVPKASRAEREPIGSELPSVAGRAGRQYGDKLTDPRMDRQQERKPRQNTHPTVKPLDLMRHLVRLVSPPGGTVLDPFLGSGTTAIACELEGFPWIGIEREAEYVAIAEARLLNVQRGMGLVA